MASKIKAGFICVNGSFTPDTSTAFGGFKESGTGREIGKEGLMAYMQAKTIKINLGI